MCNDYRVPQWEDPMRTVVFKLPSSEHVGYIVKGWGTKDGFHLLTNQNIEFEFADTKAGSKVRISYNGHLSEDVDEKEGNFVFETSCLHKIILKQIQSSNRRANKK